MIDEKTNKYMNLDDVNYPVPSALNDLVAAQKYYVTMTYDHLYHIKKAYFRRNQLQI